MDIVKRLVLISLLIPRSGAAVVVDELPNEDQLKVWLEKTIRFKRRGHGVGVKGLRIFPIVRNRLSAEATIEGVMGLRTPREVNLTVSEAIVHSTGNGNDLRHNEADLKMIVMIVDKHHEVVIVTASRPDHRKVALKIGVLLRRATRAKDSHQN